MSNQVKSGKINKKEMFMTLRTLRTYRLFIFLMALLFSLNVSARGDKDTFEVDGSNVSSKLNVTSSIGGHWNPETKKFTHSVRNDGRATYEEANIYVTFSVDGRPSCSCKLAARLNFDTRTYNTEWKFEPDSGGKLCVPGRWGKNDVVVKLSTQDCK